jgi:zinc transport system substrate-binding protein
MWYAIGMKLRMFMNLTERTLMSEYSHSGATSLMRKCHFIVMLLLISISIGLHANAADSSGGKIRSFVSILPIAYFVERVGGPNVEVSVLVGPGQDPHTFEPTPRLMAKLANSRVLFKIGFPF